MKKYRKVIPGFNDFVTMHKNSKTKWDYSKNEIDPSLVHGGTRDKYWLLCEKNHSIYRSIANIECECPECKAIRKSIAYKPYLMDFIDLKDNPGLDIYHTYAYEAKMINWRCKKCGYKWSSMLHSRKTNQCPCCDLGVVIVEGINDVLTVVPALAEDYKPELNPGINIRKYGVGDKKTLITWECHICHYIWPSTIFSRTRGHNGQNKINKCPCCGHAKRLLTIDKQYPFLIDIYNEELNDRKLSELNGLDYANKFYWNCPIHGVFPQRLSVIIRAYLDNSKTKGCPYCRGMKILVEHSFASKHPELLKIWSFENNYLIVDPYQVSENSNTIVFWKCPICGNIYTLSIAEMVIKEKRGINPCQCQTGRVRQKEHIIL